MLEGARLDPKQEIGFVAHRAVSITAEKVAINAVMAGCKAEFMPVVVAAVEGIADPRWSYHGPGTSTAGAGGVLILNRAIAPPPDVHAGGKPFCPRRRREPTIRPAGAPPVRDRSGSDA